MHIQYVMYDLNRGKTIYQSCMLNKNKTNMSGIFPKLVQSQKHVCWNMEYLKTYLSLAKRSPSKHKLGISIKGQDR